MKTNRRQIGLSLTEEEYQALAVLAKARSSKTKVIHLIYEAIEKVYFQDPKTNGNGNYDPKRHAA
jgi:predicted DNA-binding protein